MTHEKALIKCNENMTQLRSIINKCESDFKNISDNFWMAKQGSINMQVSDEHFLIFVSITCGALILSVIIHCCIACNKPKQKIVDQKPKRSTPKFEEINLVAQPGTSNDLNHETDFYDEIKELNIRSKGESNVNLCQNEVVYGNLATHNQCYEDVVIYDEPPKYF